MKGSMHMFVNPWSFIIHMGMNYVKFTGTSWRKSFLNNLLNVCLYMGGFTHFSLNIHQMGFYSLM